MNCEHYRNDFRLIARYKFMQAVDNRADHQVIERLGEWVGRFGTVPRLQPVSGVSSPDRVNQELLRRADRILGATMAKKARAL